MNTVLVLYYSRYGAISEMARLVARGIDSVPDCEAQLRTVPPVSTVIEATQPAIPDTGSPYATTADLEACDGLALGSPTRLGNMAAPLKYFFDQSGMEWLNGTLAGKPGAVFTSSSTHHGGQESTLISMMLPLLHHGMVIVGLPFTHDTLNTTRTGGTPYGASHVAGVDNDYPISSDEETLCIALGQRLAHTTSALSVRRNP